MSIKKLAVTVVCSVMLAALLGLIGYLVIDYSSVADTAYANTIMYVNDSTAPPVGYKESFAQWTYVTDSKTGESYATLSIPQPNVQLGDIGILINDGSEGTHITDTSAFEQAISSGTTDDSTMVGIYYNAINACSHDFIKRCDAKNLSIALYANAKSEGKLMMWEKSSDKWSNVGKVEGNTRYAKAEDGSYLEVASYIESKGNWFTVNANQLNNLYALGEKAPLYDKKVGLGTVQWSGSRCWNFVAHLYNLQSNGNLDFTDNDSLRSADMTYMLKELNGYMKKYLVSDNYSTLSIEQLTGFIAAVYECPANSCAFHWSSRAKGYDQYYYRGDDKSTKYEIQSGQDFWNGIITDWSMPYCWFNSGQEVSESYRIRLALQIAEGLNNQ